MIPNRRTLMTAAVTIALLATINNVPALGPLKKIIMGDNGFFG